MGAFNGDSHIRADLEGNDRGQSREEPAGLPGQKGNKGDTGAQGPKGDTGVQEQKGDTGAQGPQGAQGPKADTAIWQ